MREAIIIGSGPAAAGTALALVDEGIRPTVIDIGTRLEEPLAAARERMASTDPGEWSAEDQLRLSRQPVQPKVKGLPEKRAYGSDFVFRDLGQLEGVTAAEDAHRSVISSAYGGYSNVWGAQLMPFSRETFDDWPVSFSEMAPYYERILREVPFSGVEDDLAERFPLLHESSPLPMLSERTSMVLRAYGHHRESLRQSGVLIGQARLAMSRKGCVKCGLCMTGCPYSLVYSASHTFDRLRAEGQVEYLGGLRALRIEEGGGRARVLVQDQETGLCEQLTARRLFIACGGLGTTRLAASSLSLYDTDLIGAESAQFAVPLLSARPTSDPRKGPRFTLNQFNMVIELPEHPRDLSQIHFYSYNDAFFDALPALLRVPKAERVAVETLRRLSVGIGYLPSWVSPPLRIRVERPSGSSLLPPMHVAREKVDWRNHEMLQAVKRQMLKAAPKLDLWPVFPKAIYAAGAKSYHFGGTFPHGGKGSLSSDSLGRTGGWDRIHLVDASVFPTVPATTFTFTIMANANRIASNSMGAASPAAETASLVSL